MYSSSVRLNRLRNRGQRSVDKYGSLASNQDQTTSHKTVRHLEAITNVNKLIALVAGNYDKKKHYIIRTKLFNGTTA